MFYTGVWCIFKPPGETPKIYIFGRGNFDYVGERFCTVVYFTCALLISISLHWSISEDKVKYNNPCRSVTLDNIVGGEWTITLKMQNAFIYYVKTL